MSDFANVTVSTLCFPGDGRGSVTAIRGAASTGATTTYTTNTATDGTAWTLTTVAPGDYAFTADGFWGVVQSKGVNTITVDRWRKPGQLGSGNSWTPADAGAVTVHSPCHIAGFGGVTLKKIVLVTGGAGTLDITDQKGTATPLMRFTSLAGSGPGLLADFGEDGVYFPHPFGMKASVSPPAMQVIYE